MPEQFENVRKFVSKKLVARLWCHRKVPTTQVSISLLPKTSKIVLFQNFQMFTRCRFQNVPIRVPFSKSTVFKICRQKMCRFRVNRRPIRRIFHRFQNVPASCERSLSVPSHKNIEINQSVFGSYLWVPFSTKSVCRFLFCYILVCGVLLYIEELLVCYNE